jgi:hypothetical protein
MDDKSEVQLKSRTSSSQQESVGFLVISVNEAKKLLGKELCDKLSDNQIRVMIETLTSVAYDSLLAIEVPKTTKV